MYRKITALFLLTAMLLMSCAEKTANEEQTSQEITESSQASEESSEPTFYEQVDKPDLGGMTVNIACNDYDTNYYNVVDWEETTGDNLNDAIYSRNRFIEQQLNCIIKVDYGDPVNNLKLSATSGSGDVDLCYTLMSNGGGLIQKSYVSDFSELETIDMSKPYWDQGALKTIAIGGKMYFGFCDFGFDHYDSMAALFYNGALIDDYGLEDPFELFQDGRWTVDKFRELINKVSADLNGDDKRRISDDRFGLVGREYNLQPILNASGVSLVSFDTAANEFKFNLKSERFVNIAEALVTIYGKEQSDYVNYSDYDAGRVAFKEGRALFYSRLLGDYRNLRDVEDNYALICFPRYDYTTPETYYFVQNPTTLFLPVTIGDDNSDGWDDFDEVGSFLEAVSAYSLDTVTEVYVTYSVIGKGLRDRNSVTVLHEMLGNRTFDLTQCFEFQGLSSSFFTAVTRGSGFSSIAAKLEKQFGKSAKKIIDAIDAGI